MPKGISLLIPAYNRPRLLRRALLSVLNQTRVPDEIIVSDDNPENEDNLIAIEDILEDYSGLVRYEKNKYRLGVVGNYLKLLKLARYDYIKFLSDDDWLSPEALELMERALDEDETISLVTSVRLPVDINGEIISGVKATFPLSEETSVFEGKRIIKKSLIDLCNYVGEFSSYMFRKKFLDINPFSFCGIDFRANADWILWMYLLSKGNLFYIAKPLVFFTIHEEQDQQNLDTELCGLTERLNLILNKELHSKLGIELKPKEKALAIENFIRSSHHLSKDVWCDLKYAFNKICSFYLEFKQEKVFEFPSVSIIIVTYNSENTIQDLLISLKRSISEKDEVIIVDNASEDKTLEIVERFKNTYGLYNLRILKFSKNSGYAAAANKGAEVAKNDYLVFINPDVVLPKNWKNKVLNYLKRQDVGAVGAISNYVLDHQHLRRFSLLGCLFSENELKDNVDLIDRHLELLYDNSYEDKKLLVGFFLATKKEVFERVRGFDEKLFLGMDDLDYSLRLREIGYRLVLPKDLFIYHKGHVSFKKNRESERLKKITEHVFADKLIDKFGFGNVPNPEELWDDLNSFYFSAFVPTGKKYKFMFRYSKNSVDFIDAARKISEKPKIGIVTVSYFSSVDIERLKETLERQSYKNICWYVVDHSEDENEFFNLQKLLDTSKLDVFLDREDNKGYGAGVNYGIELALKDGCDYIWILNPDIEVEANTLLELLKTSIYTGVPVVTCKIRDSVEREKLQYDGFQVSYVPFPDYPQRIHKVSFLSGANIFISSSLVEQVRFNESYFLYFEDNDFLERLWDLGIQPLYTPYTSVYHKNKSKIFLTRPYEIYYFIRNKVLFLKERTENFNVLIKDIVGYYDYFYSKKNNLRALIEAIYDSVVGRFGKKEPIFIFPQENSLELLKEYTFRRKFTKSGALEMGKKYLLLKPRDRKIFLEFLKDIFTLLNHYRGIECQKKLAF